MNQPYEIHGDASILEAMGFAPEIPPEFFPNLHQTGFQTPQQSIQVEFLCC